MSSVNVLLEQWEPLPQRIVPNQILSLPLLIRLLSGKARRENTKWKAPIASTPERKRGRRSTASILMLATLLCLIVPPITVSLSFVAATQRTQQQRKRN